MDKMKIIITMLSMILLISLVSAGEIDTDAGTKIGEDSSIALCLVCGESD